MITLNNGQIMPNIALGTYGMTEEDLRTFIPQALDMGYRHLDMAGVYGNENLMGSILAGTSVPRDEMFLVSKVWPT